MLESVFDDGVSPRGAGEESGLFVQLCCSFRGLWWTSGLCSPANGRCLGEGWVEVSLRPCLCVL